jgi:hypothetical protein
MTPEPTISTVILGYDSDRRENEIQISGVAVAEAVLTLDTNTKTKIKVDERLREKMAGVFSFRPIIGTTIRTTRRKKYVQLESL